MTRAAIERTRSWAKAWPLLHRSLRRARALATRRDPEDPIGRVVWAFGKSYPRAFFIQVGANDGVYMDPLRDQVASRAWRGIMLEPLPHIFERLVDRYGTDPRLVLENAAIADEDGTRQLYHVPPAEEGAAVPDWYDKLGSFDRDVIAKHGPAIPDFERRLEATSVRCITFETLCRVHDVQSVDLIEIDTEGYDFEVIKLVDLDRLRPRLIVYEHLHLEPEARAACTEHLGRHGYEQMSDVLNTACLRTIDLTARDRRLVTTWRRVITELS